MYNLKILFLHPNFPGQFKFLAPYLAQKGHDVNFLCQTHYNRSLPGVKRLCLKGHYGDQALKMENNKLKGREREFKIGQQFLKGMMSLKEQKWIPEIIISHSGFGCGLYARAIFEQAKIISYLEWWFHPCSEMLSYDEANEDLNLTKNNIFGLWERNATTSLELIAADLIISPSRWQASQVYGNIKKEIKIIRDGIDLKDFCIDPEASKSEPTLTYGTRGMEPMRGFPQFIRILPELLRKWPKLRVEIAGEDQTSYSTSKPKNFDSWGKWAKEYLSEKGIDHRVTWKGNLNKDEYIKWIKKSTCHVYFTHPFVASWSLAEAYCCGSPIVTSDLACTREQCDEDTVTYVDHRDPQAIISGINATLRNHSQMRKLIANKRNSGKHSVEKSLKAWEDALISNQ